MMSDQDRQQSKFLSLVLRHQPEVIGITLDPEGWVEVDVLLEALRQHGKKITRQRLQEIVENNDKQRFAFDESGLWIRANQGHSVSVELNHPVADPPEILYHGTYRPAVSSIVREGLTKQKRHQVHLHEEIPTAMAVGQRRGVPVLLTIRAQAMAAAGHQFFVTPNRVWLTDSVPPEFILFPE